LNQIVPEALPRQLPLPTGGYIGSGSPRRALYSNGNVKVFPDDKEITVLDAARIWGAQGDRANWSTSETRSTVEIIKNNSQPSPIKENPPSVLVPGPQQQPLPRTSDGGMLFEMDVPAVAYGTVSTGGISGVQVGPVDLASPKVPATAAIPEEANNAAADVRDVAAMAERMDNIETERIPCPRLCGATFGPGIGGLAMFQNGDVRKMWLWYDRAGSSRLSGIPASISAPEQAFSELVSPMDPARAGSPDKHLKTSLPRCFPRSLKDMMDMTAAVKEAQWGEVNETDAASDDQEDNSGDNFFEYMSTGSLSSDSDNEPAEFINISNEKGSRIYENYFGNFRRPIAEPPGGAARKLGNEEHQSQSSLVGSHASGRKIQVVGPSSDTLAPTVHVTHDFDKLALNDQSAQLAREWELGQWQPEEFGLISAIQQSLASQRAYYSDQDLEGLKGEGVFRTPGSPPSSRGTPCTGTKNHSVGYQFCVSYFVAHL
jgi:hypothetical protein